MSRLPTFALISCLLAGCAADLGAGRDYTDHDEPTDFAPLTIGAPFDRNDVVSDRFFRDGDLLDAAAIQTFLENTPYGRSFLADETVGGRQFSAVLAETSHDHEVNPLLLLARMQVEKSLVSQARRPSARNAVDFAFGCGCPDGRACNEAYRGLDRQLRCGAQTHDRRYDDSVAGTGGWRRGHTRRSLDGYDVRPANHATAALYAYTPHVGLVGGRVRGGNALVHNIVNRFANRLIALGLMDSDGLTGPRPAFIGTACEPGGEPICTEPAGRGPRCLPAGDAGFCTATCAGYCPDQAGHATTFCVEVEGFGVCVPQAHALNDHCASLPGTTLREVDRFVGGSGAPAARSTVCYPDAVPAYDPEPEELDDVED